MKNSYELYNNLKMAKLMQYTLGTRVFVAAIALVNPAMIFSSIFNKSSASEICSSSLGERFYSVVDNIPNISEIVGSIPSTLQDTATQILNTDSIGTISSVIHDEIGTDAAGFWAACTVATGIASMLIFSSAKDYISAGEKTSAIEAELEQTLESEQKARLGM